ncbi:MAG: CocE/NonD family hydrolase [Chloroflexota bacterium]
MAQGKKKLGSSPSFQHDDLGIRSVHPRNPTQYPFNTSPRIPEHSKPVYSIREDIGVRIPMRDGVRIAADVFRPSAPGKKFPALLAVSPYTRQLQRTVVPSHQNEAGLTEFWVPRGYAHIIADVRGSNDSEGAWDMMGPKEQSDLFDLIEWIAQQPWCDGNVGMSGCSYFGWSQMMAATQRPPHLKAIFAFDAAIDLYREAYFHGGIFCAGWVTFWFAALAGENLTGVRLQNPSGFANHFKTVLDVTYPFDNPYYQERLSWPRLDRINIPVYFACDWEFYRLHLRGAFVGWETINTPKRMLIGVRPRPQRPLSAYHGEALRWYDYHLKGMDTRVMEGAPIQFYIPGLEQWRGEWEWPLARTQWREFYLSGDSGKSDRRFEEGAGLNCEGVIDYNPSNPEWRIGGPKLVYRAEVLDRDLEVTGPLTLHLWTSTTSNDADWFVSVRDESPDGQSRELTAGCLRASHRALDASSSKPWRPFHPHLKAEPLTPNEPYELVIEIWPTANLFKAGHRMRLDISNCDDQRLFRARHESLLVPARNTVLEGRRYPSRLIVPVIPER